MTETPDSPSGGEDKAQKKGWFGRLKAGLARSSAKITDGITGIFQKRKLDDETLEELEELLITADLGPTTAATLTASLAKQRYGKEITPQEVRLLLADEIAGILRPVAEPLTLDPARRPFVILVVGVNGAGKTTTIGKLAKQWRDAGKQVILAAGDTFRAAAIGQLQVWADRAGVRVLHREQGSDAAALAFDALTSAQAENADVLLIDTAGRLQNKENLMAELAKIVRVLRKQDETAPHAVLLVLDATTGQNAHAQVEVFRDLVDVSGLIVTKLDGSARGGVLVALAQRFGLPVHAVGVGESIEDLRPFDPGQFARSLLGVDEA